ncbi:MAG: hypothetical protein GW900_01135 [Gammaproteobacteria bacterium]|nr:hypothetical protein [Gammaproteobacteria bacterium]
MVSTRYPAGIPVEQQATHRISRQKRILAIVVVISFALDFKGAVGGSLIQFLMGGLNTAAFLVLAATCRMALPRKGLGAFVFWGWVAFLVTGTLGAFVNVTPFDQYIRIVYPFTLLLEGFLVAWWTMRNSHDAITIVSAMMSAAVVSLFFTLAWGFYFTEQGVEQIRYQILSPLIPLLIVATGYDLFFARRRRLWSLVLLVITLGVIAISVTRGPLLVVGFVVVLVLLVTFRNALRTASLPRPLIQAVVLGSFVGVIGLTIAIVFNPEALGRWVHRGLGEARNVTFWTRVAAILGQFQALNANPLGWLTGQGFGSSYPWLFSEFPWILPYLGETADTSAWFPGEFMWMPFLFYGGFIIGPIAALALIGGAVRGCRVLGALLRAQSWRLPEARPLWIGVLGYFAFLGMGFTANPFILRLAALFMGLCLGLIVAQGGSALPSLVGRRC